MLTDENMAAIWTKMARIYGHKWVSNYGTSDDGTWFEALRKFPVEAIIRGLNKCLIRSDPWPPSLPEFCQMCLSLPDIGTVTSKILAFTYDDPVSLSLRKKIGSWTLQNGTEKEIRKQIERLYESTYQEESEKTITATTLRNVSRYISSEEVR